MHIESSVEELERLLIAEQIREIHKDTRTQQDTRDQLTELKKKWKREEYINATAHNIALKRKSGIYGPADRRMERDYKRTKNFAKVYGQTYIMYACALLGILVLLSL
jgi:hypothetical protein|tara:strand:- start:586 stop:906 length:321 start_codon:yes stop_codon:yes gene_type:complete